jgi:hypothetical protein
MRPSLFSGGVGTARLDDRSLGRPGRVLAIVFSLYLAFAIIWLRPLVPDPASTRPDVNSQNPFFLADYYLILWALAWDSHALVTDPAGLFDANTFHPSPRSLAFSEHFLGMVPLFAPTYWATGNPVLAANVLIALMLASSATAMFLLAQRFTHPAGAFAAGFLYAFAPRNGGTALMQLHLLGTEYLPLAMFFTERWLERSRRRDAIGIAVCLILQSATSFYLAYGQMLAYGGYIALALFHRRGRIDRRRSLGIAAAIAAVGLAMALLSLPYLALQRDGVIPNFGEVGRRPMGLLPELVDLEVRRYLLELGVGSVGYVLAAIALPFVFVRTTRYAVCLGLAWTAIGVLAAYGPEPKILGTELWSPYRLLTGFVPGFATVRLSPRFLFVAHLGIALLAGIGLGAAVRRFPNRIAWAAAGLAVAASIATRGGIPEFPTARENRVVDVAPAVRWLAEHGRGRALLEFPPAQYLPAAERMLTSTFHRLPILEGYSAYTNRSDQYLSAFARGLPEVEALQSLVDRVDIGWLLVHTAELTPARVAAWRGTLRGLELVGEFGPDLLFRVVLPVREDLRARLFDPEVTLGGAAKRPLGSSCPGSIRVKTAPRQPWPALRPTAVRLEIRNDGDAPWPGESLSLRNLVRLRACWTSRCDEEASFELHRDVPAGGSIERTVLLRPPVVTGRQTLRFRLEQVGGSSLEECGVAALEYPVEVTSALDSTRGKGTQ